MKTTNQKSKNILKQKSNQYIINECYKILNSQNNEQTSKWFLENKITSYMLRNQKMLYTIQLSNQILKYIMQKQQPYVNRLIHILNNNIKSYEFCRFLKHFSQRDYQFQYIYQIAKGYQRCPINFYLKCRNLIIRSHLNKTKKQFMSGIVGEQNQWFKIITNIFNKKKEQQLINLYIDVVKKHYISIKKNQNQILNGGQVFKIAQILRQNLKRDQEYEDQIQKEDDEQEENKFKIFKFENTENKNKPKNNKSNAKAFINDLQVEDKQLIRALVYKDDNIARLLENKHNKMIEMITDDVEHMRKDIQEQKKKYMQIVRQKNQIIKEAKIINEYCLTFIDKKTKNTQDKLIQLIGKFNQKHFGNKLEIQKIKDKAKERRLIQQIQKQEMQID